jgi:hypothetical protein
MAVRSVTVAEIQADEVDSWPAPEKARAVCGVDVQPGGLRVCLMFDGSEVAAAFDLFAQAAERSPELVVRLVDLGVRDAVFSGDLGACLRSVQLEPDPAAPANEVRFRLELSDGVAALLAAVRAGEFDRE